MYRYSKIITVAFVAVWVSLIALGNLTDYASNFAFVSHVLSMDTTFPGNQLMGRAIVNPALHHVAYWIIIVTEITVATLCWWGTIGLLRTRNGHASSFEQAKRPATAGYLLALALWLGGFIIIGGEWFAMWQSSIWNGLDAAFRMVTIVTLFLLLLHAPDEAA